MLHREGLHSSDLRKGLFRCSICFLLRYGMRYSVRGQLFTDDEIKLYMSHCYTVAGVTSLRPLPGAQGGTE